MKLRWAEVRVPAIAALGLAITCIALYPGFINSDSQWQLMQARLGEYNNEHPPMMAFVWRYLDRLIAGEAGLFLFDASMFWAGFALFLDELDWSAQRSIAGTLFAALFLPLLASFGMLVKDGGFSYALVFCAGALFRAERRGSLGWLAVAMAALFYACSLRHNGLAAAFPLTLWAGIVAAPRWRALSQRIGSRSAAIAIGLTLFIYQGVGSFLANRRLTSKESYPAQMMLTWDLTGISVRAGRNFLPENFQWDYRPLTLSELRNVYSPDSNFFVLWGSDGAPRPGWVGTEFDYEDLRAAWLSAIVAQPRAYLEHRWAAFVRLLGFYSNTSPYWFPPSAEVAKQPGWNASLRSIIIRFVQKHWHWFVFRAYPYLAIALVCLVVALRRRLVMPAFWAVASSALLYEASYLWVSTSSDFRYSWWLMCASLLMAMMLLPRTPEPARP